MVIVNEIITRENFLKLSTRIVLGLAGLLGLGGLIRFFSFQPDPESPITHDLGHTDNFPSSGKLIRPDIPAVIYRSDQGFLAYSLICTHLGCTLEESGDMFSCPCHGSEFNSAGEVIKGPANKELDVLKVEVTDDGTLLVHTREGLL
jgi:Rieske Fe-S protein